MSPNWTGSPQHVVAGVVLALATYLVASRRSRMHPLWLAVLAVVVTMAAEAMVELIEYPLIFGASATSRDYYDTIADIGATLAGAVVAAVLAMSWSVLKCKDEGDASPVK